MVYDQSENRQKKAVDWRDGVQATTRSSEDEAVLIQSFGVAHAAAKGSFPIATCRNGSDFLV